VQIAHHVERPLRRHALGEEARRRQITRLLGELGVVEDLVVLPLSRVAPEEHLEEVGLGRVALVTLEPRTVRERPALGAFAGAHPLLAGTEPLADSLARGARCFAADVRLREDVLFAARPVSDVRLGDLEVRMRGDRAVGAHDDEVAFVAIDAEELPGTGHVVRTGGLGAAVAPVAPVAAVVGGVARVRSVAVHGGVRQLRGCRGWIRRARGRRGGRRGARRGRSAVARGDQRGEERQARAQREQKTGCGHGRQLRHPSLRARRALCSPCPGRRRRPRAPRRAAPRRGARRPWPAARGAPRASRRSRSRP
jgi:hypothetical protein